MSKPKPSQNLADYNTVAKLLPSEYLEAEDFEGKTVRVRIKHIKPRHSIRDNEPEKPLVTLDGVKSGRQVPKKWILTRFNAQAIARVLNQPEVTKWIGGEIELCGNQERHFGKNMLVIRLFHNGRVIAP